MNNEEISRGIERYKRLQGKKALLADLKRLQKKKIVMEAMPKLNFVISTYYKGTAIDELLRRLEQYIDNASKDESEINNI